jgi:glycosyltransferase involved in cell wall biosynthesis
MKILFTVDPEIPTPPNGYGGIQRIVADLITTLRDQSYEVGLVAHPDSTVLCDFFNAWPCLDSQNKLGTIPNIKTLLQAVKAFDPDIIHSFARLLYMLPVLPLNIPKIMSYQRSPGRKAVKFGSILSRNLWFTGCSQHITNLGASYAGNWEHIPNFIPEDTYQPCFNSKENSPLVFLSRLEPIKGLKEAIELAIKSKNKLVIAGNIPNTHTAQNYFNFEIKPLIELNKDAISYIGEVNNYDKQKLLSSSKALLLPLQWPEPFGIVMIEALACGTPVIVSNLGAGPEIIKNNINGFVCNNEHEYLTAISKVSNIERTKCHNSFIQNYSAKIVVKAYESLYKRITEKL